MPSSSKKQHNFMAAVANNPAFAKKAGVPQSVGKEFTAADKGVSFGGGSRKRPDLQKVNKSETRQGKNELFKEGGDTMASKMNPGMMAMMAKKKSAPAKKMADGGMTMVNKGGKMVPDFAADGKGKMAKGGMTKKMASGGMAASSMGKVRTAAPSKDGVATKGKTKGTQIVMSGNKGMKKGGMTC
jgi:hypothetical protein